MSNELNRAWINQPSANQMFHALHGVNVLAQHERDNTVRIYFLSVNIASQQINRNAISEGWVSVGQS